MNTARTHISPYGWVMVFMLFGLGVINFADKAVLGLAAVPIIKELHLSPAQYGLVSGSIFWLFALSSVLVTAWSDRIGTKKVLTLLATSWAIVQVATVFVFSFPALLLTRIVLGAGEGPSYGTSVSAAAPWLPADRRAFGLAVVTFGSAIGPAVFAPPLTFVFFMLAPIGVTVPILSTIITAAAPEAQRGAVLGTVVAVSTLPGIIAPLVTGLIIQSAGKNVPSGFYYAYLLTSLLLLIVGGVFLASARPDDEQQKEKRSLGVVRLHS